MYPYNCSQNGGITPPETPLMYPSWNTAAVSYNCSQTQTLYATRET